MTYVGYVLLALGGLFAFANWAILVTALRTKRSSSSVGPFGGIFMGVGAALVPAVGWKLGLLALVADPFCLFVILWSLHLAIRPLRSGRGQAD